MDFPLSFTSIEGQMKVKFKETFETNTHVYQAGREYDVPESVVDAAKSAGVVDEKPELQDEPELQERKAVESKPARKTKKAK